MSFTYPFPHPSITGDVIVWDHTGNKVLLIKRKKDPYANCWAIVGGFFNPQDNGKDRMDESVRDAAIRELKEEVNIEYRPDEKFGRFSLAFLTIQDKPGRDSRGRVVTMVYVLTVWDGIDGLNIKAQDDALEVQWFDMKDVLSGKIPLAFDHLDSIKKFANGVTYV